jgi:UDP-2,3-diacylglucosamine pyrophosphatase LpxH
MPKVRTVFLSDIHLGTRACQADRLLEFLKEYPAEKTYLVGDIIDFWAMKRSIVWTPAQNTVVQKMLRRARHGEEIVFIPGNHDEALRDHFGVKFGDITIVEEAVHTTADGKKFLLVHGDMFDQVTMHHKWLAVIGDIGYESLVKLNLALSWVRRKLGISGYWSLAGYAKRKVKTALNFIFDFEDVAVHHARERGMDGIICGHIHWATIKDMNGTLYINCGDWVDSCTAIVEHHDGQLELIQWGGRKAGEEHTTLVSEIETLVYEEKIITNRKVAS